MSLPKFSSSDQAFNFLQTQWASILDPIINKVNQLTGATQPGVRVLGSGSGTYKPPENVLFIRVRMVGGGGGGGGAVAAGGGQAAAGSGGSGAGYVEHIFTNLASGYSYSVGNGGSGAGAGGGSGNDGQDSTFAGLIAGKGLAGSGGGGTAGSPGIGAGGASGGTASGGNLLNVLGMPSLNSLLLPGNGQAVGSAGGNSYLGFGAMASQGSASGFAAANNTGAGGSGGCSANGNGAAAGGAGGSGLILIEEYYQ